MTVNPVASTGFSRAADAYERSRPSYAQAAITSLADDLRAGPDLRGRGRCRILDLAAGTGKLTRLLLPLGDVVAVEPVAEMRAHVAGLVPAAGATAELLPFRDHSLDAVTVGQAFHWFDASAALAEISRVLRPGGVLALLWNDRDDRVPWVREITNAIHARDPGTTYDKDIDWPAVIAASSDAFTKVEVTRHEHDHPMDVELVVDRAMSTSYVAAAADDVRSALAGEVRSILAANGIEGAFPFPHVTVAYVCRRR